MQNGEQYMKQKRKFTRSLIRPIFNALIGLIMLLSTAIGIVGYFEFADVLKEQYTDIANGIAENVALGIDAGSLTNIWKTKQQMMSIMQFENSSSIPQTQRIAALYMSQKFIRTQKRENTYTMLSVKKADLLHMTSDIEIQPARKF